MQLFQTTCPWLHPVINPIFYSVLRTRLRRRIHRFTKKVDLPVFVQLKSRICSAQSVTDFNDNTISDKSSVGSKSKKQKTQCSCICFINSFKSINNRSKSRCIKNKNSELTRILSQILLPPIHNTNQLQFPTDRFRDKLMFILILNVLALTGP